MWQWYGDVYVSWRIDGCGYTYQKAARSSLGPNGVETTNQCITCAWRYRRGTTWPKTDFCYPNVLDSWVKTSVLAPFQGTLHTGFGHGLAFFQPFLWGNSRTACIVRRLFTWQDQWNISFWPGNSFEVSNLFWTTQHWIHNSFFFLVCG